MLSTVFIKKKRHERILRSKLYLCIFPHHRIDIVFHESTLVILPSHLIQVLEQIGVALVDIVDTWHVVGELESHALRVLAQHVQGGLRGLDAVEVAGDQLQLVLLGVGGGIDLENPTVQHELKTLDQLL